MPRTQGVTARCLGCRQHKLPEAGQAVGPDLSCAGSGPCALCIPGCSCLPTMGKGAAWGCYSCPCARAMRLWKYHPYYTYLVMAYNPLASIPQRNCALQPLCGVQADLHSPILHAPALMVELPFSLIDIPINICRFLFLVEATAGWTS